MKVAYAFVIICSCAAWQAFAQTSIDLRTQAKSVDFSAATSTKPAKVSAALPAVSPAVVASGKGTQPL